MRLVELVAAGYGRLAGIISFVASTASADRLAMADRGHMAVYHLCHNVPASSGDDGGR